MTFSKEHQNPNGFSPLVLAYIGDSVYDLYMRSRLVSEGNAQVNTLHKRATKIVNAIQQCNTFHQIEERLTEQELRIFKRGRNTKALNAPHKGFVLEYRHATGLETLIGYLYIDGQEARLNEILEMCYETIDSETESE